VGFSSLSCSWGRPPLTASRLFSVKMVSPFGANPATAIVIG
jgi:hypothetical protein